VPGESWFFGCTQCGKCCNSAPRATIPELFHHQARFVGCLGIRRRAGEVELFTHAFSYTSLAACPALAADRRCTIYDDRKPTVCGVVPLDATLPDSEQHRVLTTRQREARYFGADCIRRDPAPGFRELTRHLRVVDAESASLLERHRRELADERRFWGNATASLLGPDLLDDPERVRALPEDGALSISLVPVLSLLAAASERCRIRVIEYLRAQLALQAALIDGALRRRNSADRSETALLRKLSGHSANLLSAVQSTPTRSLSDSRALEAWLGV
jgi:Fe-S-cluster containining protein